MRGPAGQVWYTHHATDGHKVEPVAMETADVIHVCDFCLTPHPTWAIPLEEHATNTSPAHPELGWTVTAVDTDGWWAACVPCMELVVAHRIGKLRDRVFALVGMGELSAWEKQSILDRLAAFWLAVPGPPVEIM